MCEAVYMCVHRHAHVVKIGIISYQASNDKCGIYPRIIKLPTIASEIAIHVSLALIVPIHQV